MRASRSATLAAVVLALTACSSGGAEPPPERAVEVAVESPAPSPTEEPAAPAGPTVIATAYEATVDVYADPTSGEVLRRLEAAEVVSLPGQIPVTFMVVDQRDGWVQVQLPVRPNGSTGWLRAEDVALTATELHVEVSLSERRLVLRDGSRAVLDVPVGIGREDAPTPGGVYYVKELLQPPAPDGPYGAYAYGLSGFSPVLDSFAGGEGVIGIHGTNDPASIGSEVSHGCIRMRDEDVTRLVEEFGLPLGAPVRVLA